MHNRLSFRTGDMIRVVTRTMLRDKPGHYVYHNIRFDELLYGQGLWIRGMGDDGRRYTIPTSNILRIDPIPQEEPA